MAGQTPQQHARKADARRIEAEIRNVFVKVWNPIGIEGLPPNEYDRYIGRLYGLLTRSSDEEIAAELLRIEREEMGLSHRDSTVDRTVAALRAIRLEGSSTEENP